VASSDRPSRRTRLLRDLLIALTGLALGVGGALAVRAAGRPGPDPSVTVLELPGGPAQASGADTGPTGPIAAGSARAAVAAHLDARAEGDGARAYRLLDRAGRARWATLAEWTASLADARGAAGL
jgi:hypothetical protein